MSDINLFELAAREKLRFPSVVGALTVEQLWDLPLQAKSANRPNLDLDNVARAINGELKSIGEQSFVATTPNPRQKVLQQQLDIVKRIISVKQDEAKVAADRKAKADKRAVLLQALADRETTDLKSKSKEELLAELNALDA